jgi:hypothetical protein
MGYIEGEMTQIKYKNAVTMAPHITTLRHPKLLVNPDTIGPLKNKKPVFKDMIKLALLSSAS